MNVEFCDNSTEHRYEVWADGERAGHAQYALRKPCIAFIHPEVYEPYKGKGLHLGSRLAQWALDDARPQTGGNAVLPVHRGFH